MINIFERQDTIKLKIEVILMARWLHFHWTYTDNYEFNGKFVDVLFDIELQTDIFVYLFSEIEFSHNATGNCVRGFNFWLSETS